MEYTDYASLAWAFVELLTTFAFYFLIAGLLLVVLTVLLKPRGKKPDDTQSYEDSANVNEYLDKILEHAALQVHKLSADPLTLPNADKNFLKQILFLKISGGLKTKRGKLKGLSTVHRAGNATFALESLTSVTIRATLGINNMKIGSEANAWLGRLALNFFIAANVKYLKLTAELQIPIFGRRRPQATNLVIDEIGTISLDVKNMGYFNRPLQGLGYVLLNLSRGTMKNRIAAPIEMAVNEMLENIKFPRLFKMFMSNPTPSTNMETSETGADSTETSKTETDFTT